MPSQVTITAKTGPANQVTTRVFNPVSQLNFDFDKKVIQIFQSSNVNEFDMTGVATVTDSVSANNHTIVIS